MDFPSAIIAHTDQPVEKQKELGEAQPAPMGDAHTAFLGSILKMIKDGSINPDDTQSFLNKRIYDALTQEQKGKVDLATVNIAHQLQLIKRFHDAKETPAESIELQSMIEQLWLMKERVEKEADVFVF